MPSSPLENIHDRTTSGVTCHHLLLTTHTIIQHRVRYAIIALGLHKWSVNIGRGMPTWALGSINGRKTSGVTCHHRPFAAHTIRFFRAWHAHMVLGQHTQSSDIDCCMPSSPLGSTLFQMMSGVAFHYRPWKAHTVGRRRHCMSSFLMESIHGWTTSGVASYYRPCTEHTIKCCWAWHACMALRQHTQLDYDRRVMPSLPLDSMYTWKTLCVHAIIALGLHTWSDDVGCGMFECPLGSTHGRMTSGMTFHYRTREELTVERRRA